MLGLAYLSPDRAAEGLCVTASIAENAIAGHHRRSQFQRLGLLKRSSIARHVEALLDSYSVRRASAALPIGTLSGGNQQRVAIARELDGEPACLIACQPTRGVDIHGIAFIHKCLLDYRDKGGAVLLISEELDEIVTLADRILVIYNGENPWRTAARQRYRDDRTPDAGRPAMSLATASTTRRSDRAWIASLVQTVGPLVLALILGAVVLAISGHNPLTTYKLLATESFGSWKRGGRDARGRHAADLHRPCHRDCLPHRRVQCRRRRLRQCRRSRRSLCRLHLHVTFRLRTAPAAILASVIAGALWMLVPALLKSKLDVDEVVTTLMLNFVAVSLTAWLVNGRCSRRGRPIQPHRSSPRPHVCRS